MRNNRPSELSILRLARKLLARGEKLARGSSALDRFGGPVHWGDRAAVSFCPVGAVYRAAQEIAGARAILSLSPRLIAEDTREHACASLDRQLPNSFRKRGLVAFSDARHTTRREVLALFDKAIEALEPRRIFDEAV